MMNSIDGGVEISSEENEMITNGMSVAGVRAEVAARRVAASARSGFFISNLSTFRGPSCHCGRYGFFAEMATVLNGASDAEVPVVEGAVREERPGVAGPDDFTF